MISNRLAKALYFFLCSIALVGATHAADVRNLTTNDIQAASKTLGLNFSEREQEQMLNRLEGQLENIAAQRRFPLSHALQPAFVFDPRPPGFRMPEGIEPFRWTPATGLAKPANEEDLAFATVGELAALLRARVVTSAELTKLSLARLKRYGPNLRCVATLSETRALAAAQRADEEIASGQWRGPLHGVPCGVKDLLDMAGLPSGWGVSIYTNRLATTDATVVRKLEEAGAVIVAKFSLGELAMGDVWHGGMTRNPWDLKRGSSGSSAGSSSAVAAGLVPFAIGSETLGSIVSPAMTCGITGLRPTFGRVSRAGAMTLSFTMDKIGVLARSVEDTALVLDSIRGPDATDRSVIAAPFNYPSREKLKSLRIGFLESDFQKDYGQKTNDQAALEALRRAGFELRPVALPPISGRPFRTVIDVEAAAFFDDLTRSNDDDKLVQQGNGSWPNTFRAARFVSAVDYLQANRLRSQLMAEMDELFRNVDVLVAPSWNGNQLNFSNLTGHPSVVVPNGDAAIGPAGFCFLAGLFREGDALAVASAFQAATDWHRRRPDLQKVEALAE